MNKFCLDELMEAFIVYWSTLHVRCRYERSINDHDMTNTIGLATNKATEDVQLLYAPHNKNIISVQLVFCASEQMQINVYICSHFFLFQ